MQRLRALASANPGSARFPRAPRISRGIGIGGGGGGGGVVESAMLVRKRNRSLDDATAAWKDFFYDEEGNPLNPLALKAAVTRHDRVRAGEPLRADWTLRFGSVAVQELRFGSFEWSAVVIPRGLEFPAASKRIKSDDPPAAGNPAQEARIWRFGAFDPPATTTTTTTTTTATAATTAIPSLCDVDDSDDSDDDSDEGLNLTTSRGGLMTGGGVFGRICGNAGLLGMTSRCFSSAPSRDGGIRELLRCDLPGGCELVLQTGDITKWRVDGRSDAIVNAANELMLGGGGVDGAIHRAAGPDLLKACKKLPLVAPGVRCEVGMAVVTPGFQLPVARIVHTVGPVYHRESRDACAEKLASAYRSSLELARDMDVKYIAFPAISCGIYGYPLKDASEVALSTVKENAQGFSEIHFVLFETPVCEAWVDTAKRDFGES